MEASIVERFNRIEKYVEIIYVQWKLWIYLLARLLSEYKTCEGIELSISGPLDVTLTIADKLLNMMYSSVKVIASARFKVGDAICMGQFKMTFKKVIRQIGPRRCLKSSK